ncbi:hypothetical protein [Agrococcus sp. ARC_14]|uniref:hypothetical protein n=1 Tax=Agrococcus sp. ARC_14 TaxID=2919927 RepID=UPI001F0563CA|nr:hypothetical protein [Agrococcus sp. ARC_14]MCH1884138.1 hypothetical protein [Agrococcus sp. ARC_14]
MQETIGWSVTAKTEEPGWLEIPVREEIDADAWVAARAEELRQDWGERWHPEHEVLVPAALEHGLARRRLDDALCFQYWPVRELRVAIVHVAFGAIDEPIDWSTVDGALSPIELPEIGPGVQRVFREQQLEEQSGTPVELVGVDIICSDELAVAHLRLEPTLPGFVADVVSSFHAFAGSVSIEGPAGPFRSSEPPAEALGTDAVWREGTGA